MRSRKTVAVGAAATLLAGAAWFGVEASAADGHHSSALHAWEGSRPVSSVAQAKRLAGGGQSLTVVAHENRSALVDVGAPGDSPGDYFLSEETLYNATGTKVVGRDAVRCELGLRTFTCEATGRINGRGKIRIAGTVFGENDNLFPVTGGTQKFIGVGGALHVYDLRGGETLLVFNLVR